VVCGSLIKCQLNRAVTHTKDQRSNLPNRVTVTAIQPVLSKKPPPQQPSSARRGSFVAKWHINTDWAIETPGNQEVRECELYCQMFAKTNLCRFDCCRTIFSNVAASCQTTPGHLQGILMALHPIWRMFLVLLIQGELQV
jgi:hypothetical protein